MIYFICHIDIIFHCTTLRLTKGFILVSADIEERVKTINEYFTFSLYCNVCRSLFEKNKLHFAFLLTIRILMNAGKINPDEWRHFLAGGTPSEVHCENNKYH